MLSGPAALHRLILWRVLLTSAGVTLRGLSSGGGVSLVLGKVFIEAFVESIESVGRGPLGIVHLWVCDALYAPPHAPWIVGFQQRLGHCFQPEFLVWVAWDYPGGGDILCTLC